MTPASDRRAQRRARLELALAGAALALAALIYLVARDGLRMHRWAAELGLELGLVELPDVLRFVVPDGLWQFAFCLVVFGLWRGARPSPARWICLAVPVVIGVGSELGQAAGLIEGAFDPLDLASMALATVLAWAIAGRERPRPDPARAP